MFQTKELKDKLKNVIKEQGFNFNEVIDMVKINNMITDNFKQDWYMEEIRGGAGEYDGDLYVGFVNDNGDIIYTEEIARCLGFDDEQDMYEYLIRLDNRTMERMEDRIFTVIIEEDDGHRAQSFRTYEKARTYFEKVKTDFAKSLDIEDLEEYNKYQNDGGEDYYKYGDDKDNNIVLSIYVSELM